MDNREVRSSILAHFYDSQSDRGYKLGSMAEAIEGQVTPGPGEMEQVDVALSMIGLQEYSEALAERMRHDTLIETGREIPLVTTEEFRRMACTLLQSRVAYAVGWGRGRGPEPIVRYNDNAMLIPPFLAEVLENVGYVRLEEVAIEFVPYVNFAAEDLMTLEEIHSVFRRLHRMRSLGWHFATEFKRNSKGDESFMTLQCVEGMVRSHQGNATILKTVIAYFLGMVQTRTLLGHRIEYCHLSTARSYMFDLLAKY